MMNLLSSFFVSGCLLAVTASPVPIGSIKSSGEFRVDSSVVRGNSTVFDGDVIETEAARSVVDLTGVQITLSPNSRAKLFRDRTILENGTGLISNAGKHVMEAATLRIASASKDSVLQIETSGPKYVLVSARSGSAEVWNSSGVLVASVRPGMALAFDPQAGASAAAKITGTLRVKGETFLLTDATTNVTVELRGTGLAKYAGQKVSVTGSIIKNAAAATGASEVIQVTAIDAAAGTKKAAATAGAAGTGAAAGGAPGTAGAAAGAGAAGGLSTAATVAIVAGVGVAGGVAGLAVTGTFSGSSSASRQ
jgi:hypothetical protein